jgi:DNA end-binding protein Ku
MARSLWTGSIGFGLVNVPVVMYGTTSAKQVRFNQINPATGNRVGTKRVDAVTDEEVEYASIVSGYEISKGRYVLIDPEELKAVRPRATHTIDVDRFVDADQIDPMLYGASYYLSPGDGGAKAYRLLADAMAGQGKVGIARFVMRTKEHLAVIRPVGNLIVLSDLAWAEEVQPYPGEPVDDAAYADAELAMAEQLVASLSTDFDHSEFRDEYRDQVLDMIQRKAAGEQIEAPAEPEAPAEAPDLMATLKASIAAAPKPKARKATTKREKVIA